LAESTLEQLSKRAYYISPQFFILVCTDMLAAVKRGEATGPLSPELRAGGSATREGVVLHRLAPLKI
jgi:hypothetical protein